MLINDADIDFAMRIINKGYARHNTAFDMDDLVSEGMCGLLNAVNRYDEFRGGRKTYLYRYVLGAVKEFLRAKFFHGRTRNIDIPMLPLDEWTNNLMLSVDGTEQRVANKEIWDLVRTTLEPKKVILLGLYFFDGYTAKEIGEMFEVTESRICQLMKESFQELKPLLEDGD